MLPLIFLHGFTGSAQSWAEIRNKLKSPSFAIDLPGHGNNIINDISCPYTFENWNNDFSSQIENKKLDKIHLCGYSMGGRLAISFANAYPQKIESLILISSTPGMSDKYDRTERCKSDLELSHKIKNEFQKFINEWESLDFFSQQKIRNPEGYKIQKSIRNSQNPIQLAFALDNLGIGIMPNYWDKISKFDFPVLIVCGDEDSKFCSIGQKMSEIIPNSQFNIVSNSGHSPQLEQPFEVANLINKFIKS